MENRSGLLTHYRNIHKINLDPGKMLEYRPQLEIANQPVISDTIGTTSTSQQVANTSDSPKFPE